MLISLVKSRQFSASLRCFALLSAGVVLHGCASGPDFSRMSPSNWPGAKQVAGAGRAIGGWVSDKAKSDRAEPRLPKSVVARRDPGPVVPGGQTGGNLRSFFAAANDSEPTDPFLAQLTEDQPAVESVSHTNRVTETNNTANTETAVTRIAHSFDRPEQEKPLPRIPRVDADAPFADLAGTDSSRTKPAVGPSKAPRFAAGLDQQLAQLREETEVPLESRVNIEGDNPLRSAILGAADDLSVEEVVELPAEAELPFADTETVADVPFRVAERAVAETEQVIDESLPAWARGELQAEPKSEPMVAVEEPIATEPRIEPIPEEPTSPFHAIPEEEPIRVAEIEDELEPEPELEPTTVFEPTPEMATRVETTPKAIEIVPFRQNSIIETPAVANVDKSQQVEMLPPPPEPIPGFGSDSQDEEAVAAEPPSFSGMIVESDALPSGFAEWEGPDSTATLRTNSPTRAEPVSLVRRGEVTARLAVNSSQSLVDSSASRQYEGLMQSRTNAGQPRLLDDQVESNPFANEQPSEPRLFAPSAGGVQVAESSLEAIEWDPKTEPGMETENSLFSSTAIVGLLIGLVCLIGLATIRRIQSAA